MNTRLIIFICLLSLPCMAQKDQSLWKTEFDFGGGFSLTTFLKIEKEGDKVLITSPQDADVRLVGEFKSKIGRLLGKSPKNGVFLRIENKQKGDSLIGNANLPVVGKVDFKGILTSTKLSGQFLKNGDPIAQMNGKLDEQKKLNYSALYKPLLEITKENIYSEKVFKTKSWKSFEKDLQRLCTVANDDIEFFFGFNMLSQNLPFTHYSLYLNNEEERTTGDIDIDNKKASVFFKEISNETAYLEIKDFSSSKEELEKILPQIIKNQKFENLIIDLRSNGGGGIEAAAEFARHIINKDVTVGYFTTNELNHSGFEKKLFETLDVLSPKTTEEFIEELKEGRGAKLVFNKSEIPSFSGRIFVLTSNQTASTCEPIVYILKNNKSATVVGEKTAGAMLSAASFDVSGKYKLMIPIADFYTYDGLRLDQTGVKPNIKISSQKALDKVLQIISEK